MTSCITKPRQHDSIDLVKFLMSILVVAIHTHPLAACTHPVVLRVYDSFCQLAVPFFFLASGYLLGIRMSDLTGRETIPLLEKSLRKNLAMYLRWSAIYFPLAVCGYIARDYSLLHGILSYIRCFVFIGESYHSWQLWYLLSLVYGLVFLILLLRLNIRKKGILLACLAAGLVCFGADELANYSGNLSGIPALLKLLLRFTTTNGRILRGLLFLPLGVLIAQHPIPGKWSIPLFAVSFVLDCCLEGSFLRNCLLVIRAVSFFCIVLQIPLKGRPIYPVLRQLSTGIYLIHMYVWVIFYTLAYGELTWGFVPFLVTVAVSLLLSAVHLQFQKRRSAKC